METPTITAFRIGDAARITVGMHTGRVGKVRGSAANAVYVEFQAPVLVTQPDGPTKSVTLPFAHREIEHVADQIPATPGRHRRLAVPTNGGDALSKAACTGGHVDAGECGWSRDNTAGYCPRHYPAWYAQVPGGAKHRAAVSA